MILGVPHHQVREAPSTVPEVHSQAPTHATEDRAPQAGNKILNTKYMDSYPFPCDKDPEILPVIMRWRKLSV